MRKCASTLESELSGREIQYLTCLLQSYQLTGKHLEIGTAAGGTLWQMMRLYQDKRPPFVVVDPMTYFSRQFETVQKNLIDHEVDPKEVDFRRVKSDEAYQKAKKDQERFDLIFIDGNHKYRYVTRDLQWLQLLNPGGLALMHDYDPRFPGVRVSVDRFLARNQNYKWVGKMDTLVAIQKLEWGRRHEVSYWDFARSEIFTPLLQIKQSISKKFNN